jgi:hypothetical protein
LVRRRVARIKFLVCEGTSRERPDSGCKNCGKKKKKNIKKMPRKSREIPFSLFFCTVVLLLSKVLTVCWIGHRDVVVLNLLSGINSATVDGGSTHRETHPSLGKYYHSTTCINWVAQSYKASWPFSLATDMCDRTLSFLL